MSCRLCLSDPNQAWILNEHAFAFSQAEPLADGHMVISPRRHAASLYELSQDEQTALWDLVFEVRARLLLGLKPMSFGFGISDALNAECSDVVHACVHVLPQTTEEPPPELVCVDWFVDQLASH